MTTNTVTYHYTVCRAAYTRKTGQLRQQSRFTETASTASLTALHQRLAEEGFQLPLADLRQRLSQNPAYTFADTNADKLTQTVVTVWPC